MSFTATLNEELLSLLYNYPHRKEEKDIKWLKERVKNQASLFTCNGVLPFNHLQPRRRRRSKRRVTSKSGILQQYRMSIPEVNKDLLAELEAMGFSMPRALNALHFSGNTNLEAAIDWILDHENDAAIDQMPLVPMDIPIEAPNSFESSDKESEQAHMDKNEEQKLVLKEEGKEITELATQLVKSKQTSQETERQHYVSEWEEKKEEERRAKEKILQKLQQDKAERIGRITLPVKSLLPIKSNMSVNQKNLESAESARKVEQMGECLRSLRRQNMEIDAQVKTVFHTLLIYVTNVVSFPENGRFRRIRLSNPAFQKRVGKFKQGVEFLELCGFVKVEGGEFLLLSRDKVDIQLLKAASALLHSAITNPFFGLLSKADM